MQRASEARKIGRLPALARTPEHGARTRTPRTSQPWDVALDESPLTGGLDSLAMPTFARADVYGDDGGQQGDQDTDEDEEFVPHNSDTDSDAAYDDDAPDDAYAAADLIVARRPAGLIATPVQASRSSWNPSAEGMWGARRAIRSRPPSASSTCSIAWTPQ